MPKKKKFGKITNISISVILKDGEIVGSPWFSSSSKARNYMRRKLNRLGFGGDVRKIQKHVWRDGMTLDDVETVRLKRL